MAKVSERTVGRLSLYRRMLVEASAQGMKAIYSHQLARLAGVTAAQVRRDLMAVGHSSSPIRGYGVADLGACLSRFLDAPQAEGLALVGLGNLGRAILAYVAGRHPSLSIVAAFDVDPSKVGRVHQGCRCYPMHDLNRVVKREGIRTAILAVPAPAAQEVAEQVEAAGMTGILNFAPTSLRLPASVYVEPNDLTMSLERVAFFARKRGHS